MRPTPTSPFNPAGAKPIPRIANVAAGGGKVQFWLVPSATRAQLGATEPIMHAALVLLGFWVFAFVTLCLALVALNIYSDLIDYGFTLNSVGKEVTLAAICSLIEAASVWAVVTYVPAAARALFIPILVIALLYTLAHLEDWNRFDGLIVVVFQIAIGGFLACLFTGNFGAALIIAMVFVGALAAIGSIAKGL